MKNDRHNLTLVVLAAGIGSRYGGLKQMDPVGPAGEFLLDYTVYDAVQAGFNRVVFVIRDDIEAAFREVIGSRIAEHVSTTYVCQELADVPQGYEVPDGREKPWGTGHAVLTCREAVDGPFASVNADDYYGRESYTALADFLSGTAHDPAAYSMVGFQMRNTLSDHGTVSRGVCSTDDRGCLTEVVERTRIQKTATGIDACGVSLSGQEIVSMNIWGLKPSIFGHLAARFCTFLDERGDDPKAEFFMPTVINTLIHEKLASVKVLETGSTWFGVTYPEDKDRVVAAIRKRIRRGEYPESLWS